MKTFARISRALTALALSIACHPVLAQATGGLAPVHEQATGFRDGIIPIVGVVCGIGFIIIGMLYAKRLIGKEALWTAVVGTVIAGSGAAVGAFFFG